MDNMNYELDSEPDTWRRRRRSSPAVETTRCRRIPRRSTTVTVVVLGLAILSCLLGYCVLSETAPYDSKSLRLVSIIFRHGARNPSRFCKADPFKNYNWPEGLGSLTNVGKLQLYELGKKFRSYYSGFLPEEYQEKDVYILSSDVPRCLMSAYTLLAGMYPPSASQIWHPDILWQPIPVHSVPRDMDKLLAGKKPCRNYEKQLEEAYTEVSSRSDFAELFGYIGKHCNQTMRSVLDVEFLYATFQIEQEAQLKLPDWTKNVYPDKMEHIARLSLATLTHNTSMIRMRAGPLLDDIIQKMQQKAAHNLNPDRSLFLYSAHDVTVVNAWRSLGLRELIRPEFGASLVVELHQDSGSDHHFVKAFYWNHTKVEAPVELALPLCPEPCTLADFRTSLQPHLPTDWDAECTK